MYIQVAYNLVRWIMEKRGLKEEVWFTNIIFMVSYTDIIIKYDVVHEYYNGVVHFRNKIKVFTTHQILLMFTKPELFFYSYCFSIND